MKDSVWRLFRRAVVAVMLFVVSGCSLFSDEAAVRILPLYDGPHATVPCAVQLLADVGNGWHTWRVEWGDGAWDEWSDARWNNYVEPSGNARIVITHQYAEEGKYRVVVIVDGRRIASGWMEVP